MAAIKTRKQTLPMRSTAAYPDMPGDTRRRMTQPYRDDGGNLWRDGTVFTPLTYGTSSVDGEDARQVVFIDGRTVTFVQMR